MHSTEPTLRQPAPGPAAASGCVLVATEDRMEGEALRRQFGILGRASCLEVDGGAAIARWRGGGFALVLADLPASRLGGCPLVRAIREEEPADRRTAVARLHHPSTPGAPAKPLDGGFDAVLARPVRLPALRRLLDRVPAQATGDDPSGPGRGTPADLAVLTALIGDDPALLLEVVHAFRCSAALHRDDVVRGAAAGDGQEVVAAAHKLRAAARSVGAFYLGDLCAQIEEVGEGRHSGELDELLPLFADEVAAVLAFVAPCPP